MQTSTRLYLLPAFAALLSLLAGSAQAALQMLDNQSLSEVSGQNGISIRVDLQATINKVSWVDDGSSISLRNVKIDNGCLSPTDCPNGAGGGFAFGPAKLGLTLPFFGIDLPTLQVDVVQNAGGTQQLQLTLPDLTTINQQLIDGGLPAQTIKVRVAADMYVGESNLGNLEIRDITDIHGTIRVWGH
ncbi:MAG: hypothetical protein K2X80_18880 [Pseudomonadaceae bacterium]|nr:hypothetical protein [Pseudomonadaceae bacterium]